MTAVGGLLGLRRVLGDDGAPAARAGLAFPESHPLPATVLPALEAAGVQVDVVPSSSASSTSPTASSAEAA